MNPEQQQRAKQFVARLVNYYTGAALSHMIHIGYETGLFDAGAQGPATCEELAHRAGLQERYVREWLGAMTTGGIFHYHPDAGTYALPEEHATFLAGTGSKNVAPISKIIAAASKPLPELIECFRNGGGVPSEAFRPEFTRSMDDVWRRLYDEALLTGFVDVVPGLTDRLREGIQVMELGCGTGHCANLLAEAFPASTVTGIDVAEDAIAEARAEAKHMGLGNVEHRLEDITRQPQAPRYDLVTAFDVIHDLPEPQLMLQRVRECLRPGGLFLMIEFAFSSHVENNVGNAFAPLYYSISTMYCMTVSLAHNGQGLGAVWGDETARRLLAEAGFSQVEQLDAPRPQNVIYVCRP